MTRHSCACALCGCVGHWVDTTAGEVIGPDGRPDPDQQAAPGATLLLAGREDGSDPDGLYCADCARCLTPAQQLRRLITVHRLRRQQIADACGVSLSTVGSWLRPDGGRARREMPARHLDLLRYELAI